MCDHAHLEMTDVDAGCDRHGGSVTTNRIKLHITYT